MKLALDYDNTYTRDPVFWNQVIRMSVFCGHEVRIVTARNDGFDRTPALIEIEGLVQVVYCRGVAKKWFMTHFGDGFIPDIWIDDRPESIFNNSEISPEQLAEWRQTRPDNAVAKGVAE